MIHPERAPCVAVLGATLSGEHRAVPATTQKGMYEAKMSTNAHATLHRGRNSDIEHESGSLLIQLFLLRRKPSPRAALLVHFRDKVLTQLVLYQSMW